MFFKDVLKPALFYWKNLSHPHFSQAFSFPSQSFCLFFPFVRLCFWLYPQPPPREPCLRKNIKHPVKRPGHWWIKCFPLKSKAHVKAENFSSYPHLHHHSHDFLNFSCLFHTWQFFDWHHHCVAFVICASAGHGSCNEHIVLTRKVDEMPVIWSVSK